MDKKIQEQIERLVDHLLKTAISEITDKLPAIVKETVYKQLEQVFKVQEDIRADLGHIRDDFNGFDKRLSDLQILVDTIDSRTTQIKVTQDKGPKNMEQHVTNAVNDAVAESVPAAMESVIEPKKKKLQIIPRQGIFNKIKMWGR
jgi:hypothetical protein